MQRSRAARVRVAIDDCSFNAARADLLHHGNEALERDDWGVDVGSTLEPRRCLGLQAKLLAGLPDRSRFEVRAFEHDPARRF